MEKRIERIERSLKEGNDRMDSMHKIIEENSIVIKDTNSSLEENNKNIDRLVDQTAGLIEAWEAGTGALKVVKFVAKVVIPIATAAAAFAAAWHYFKDHFL